jgi:hypothetical protein
MEMIHWSSLINGLEIDALAGGASHLRIFANGVPAKTSPLWEVNL